MQYPTRGFVTSTLVLLLSQVTGSGVPAALAGGTGTARSEGDRAAVARVNGKPLTEAEFHRRCERFVGGRADTAVGFLVVKEWIDQTLAEGEAASKGLLPTDADIDRRIKALRKQFEFRGTRFDQWLAEHGRTLETLRADVRQQVVAENLLTEGVKVSDVELSTYYAGNKQLFGTPEQIRVSRMTIADKKRAQEIDAALKAGTDFADLASRSSIDPYRGRGGSIPDPIPTEAKSDGALEKPVLQAALKLAKGKTSGPIKVENYWVFVRVDEKTPARSPDLADIADLLMANLKVQKGGQARLKAAQTRLNQLQREATIEINRPEYRSLLKHFQAKP